MSSRSSSGTVARRACCSIHGEELASDIVLSNADPKRTYLGLSRSAICPPTIVARSANQIERPVIKINMAVRELPKFLGLPDDSSSGSTGGLLIAPSIDTSRRRTKTRSRASRPTPVHEHPLQSAVDRTVAQGDMHTISIFTQYFPYTLAEGTWDERRDEVAQNVIREFAKFAPNIPDAIVGMQVLTPPDIEARFGMTGGHIFHGELVPEQAFDMRPVPGSSSYEGPIGGLFLCGSGAWPGGCVWARLDIMRRMRLSAGCRKAGSEGSIGPSMKVLISADMEGTCGRQLVGAGDAERERQRRRAAQPGRI